MFRPLGWRQPLYQVEGAPAGETSPPPPPPPASPPPPPPPPAESPQPPAWSDQVKGIADEQVRGFAERFTSLAELAKGGLELRRAASSRDGLVRVPTDKSTPEEIAAWRKAVGIPDAPEAYAIEIPKGALSSDADKSWWGELQRIAHEGHVPRATMEKMTASFFQHGATIVQMQEAALAKIKEAETAKLRSEWSGDYDRNWQLGERAHVQLGDADWDTFAKEVGFYDHPAYRRFLARVGSQLAPHNPLIAYTPAESSDNMESLKTEYDDRARKGTLLDPDFQRRWREGWVRLKGQQP